MNKPVMGMVLKGYPRISETFISNEIRLLEEQGLTVHIFSMRQPRENFTHKSVEAIKARVTYLPSEFWTSLHRFLWPNLRTLLSYPTGYAKSFRLACKRFLHNHNFMTFKHFFQGGYLVHHARELNLTHLHAHFAHSPTSVAMFASEIRGVPFSFTGHAKDIYTSDATQLAEKIDKARFVVTCTKYNKAFLENLVQGRREIHCVYHGIDLELFFAHAVTRTPEPPYTFLTIARIVEKKGIPDILEALALLARENFPFRYVLIGSGDDKDAVKARVRELGLEGHVEMPGTMAHDQVLEHFQTADCFVLGCRIARSGDRDGIPNVLAESMAMGVPVIGTRVSGIPELVEHEETGLLVDATRPEELAAALKRIVTDQALRAKIIPAARQKVTEVFDNKKLIVELIALYRNLTNL
ncbi:Glycosyltransferase involved in cell wall bisynthesis [Desulfomicrobium norvegicum]|uniref:Glycosyltransferase involved in cell wall bisynthesis n=1 Tax=Desulfomicrobium norvegicum (strain DSM 1741 / NCIMB 8310) TaxID=52561 RepID=A0A8G2F879_DESNO|nr:glycosyltransferase [Desulfomicrobium norvegicum]SFL79174.1 Glycosyltransferase involved in cell wall bisynthesis [Desulfomicrobium norvegicum]